MTFPDTTIVEIAFDSDPFSASPVWTDVSADFDDSQPMTISRGRSYELDDAQPGTLSLTLLNDNGDYTPGRGQFVTLLNPGFESNATFWSGAGSSIARDTTVMRSGVASLKVTPNGGGTATADQTSSGAASPVVAGESYTLNAWVYSPAGWAASGMRAVIFWRNSVPANISELDGNTTVIPAGKWTKVSVTGIAPAGAVAALCRIQQTGAPAVSDVWYLDDVSFVHAGSNPNVKTGKRIRVSAIHSAVTYYLFDGTIDSFQDAYDSGGTRTAKVQIAATDRFKQLGRYSKFRSQLEQEILKHGPTSYYPLTEADDTADEAGNVSQTTFQYPLVLGQNGVGGTGVFGSNPGEGPTDDGQSTLRLTPASSTNGLKLSRQQTPFGGDANGLTVGIHLRTTVAGRTAFTLVDSRTFTTNIMYVELDGTGHASVTLTVPEWTFSTHVATHASLVLNDNTTYFIAVVLDCGTGAPSPEMRLYVDAGQDASATVLMSENTVTPTFNQLYIGEQHATGTPDLWSGDLSHFFVVPHALTQDDLADIFSAGQNGMINELSGQRAERVAGYAGYEIPALNANVDFESGITNWTGTGGATIALSNVFSVHGVGLSARIAPDGVTSTPAIQSEEVPVIPGLIYQGRGYLYDTQAGLNDTALAIRWYNSAHVLISTTTQESFSLDAWDLRTVADTAPAAAAYARLVAYIVGTPAASYLVYVDDMKLYTDFDLGNSTMGKQILSGKNGLDALREIVTAEDGLCFVNGQGRIKFYQREHRWSQPASFTLTADQINPDVDFTLDETLLLNDVRATSGTGVQVRAFDQSSITGHGPFETELETLLFHSDDTLSRAQALVATFSEPEVRSSAVTVDAFTQASLYPALLASELGQRFTVTGMPSTAPASSLDLVIESLQHVVQAGSWAVTFECTPGTHLNYWSLDDPTYGKVGQNRLAW